MVKDRAEFYANVELVFHGRMRMMLGKRTHLIAKFLEKYGITKDEAAGQLMAYQRAINNIL